MTSKRPGPGRRERGVVAVLAAIVIVTIGGFMALALNMGVALDSRAELQNAADSSALAGAGSLNGITGGLTTARSMAKSYSGAHQVTNQAVTIDYAGSDVLFGAWHFASATCAFSTGTCAFGFEAAPSSPSATDIQRINAVKVINGRDGTGSHNAALPVFFHGMLGNVSTMSVGSYAIAVGPGAIARDCVVPFALPICNAACDTEQRRCLSDSGSDMMGFISLEGDDSTNTQDMVEEILGSCTKADPVTTGDYPIGNGSNMNDQLLDALFGVEKRQGNKYYKAASCLVGRAAAFPVIDANGCASFSGDQPVYRFVSATILKVTDNNGQCYKAAACPSSSIAIDTEITWPPTPDASCAVSSACGTGGSKRSLYAQLNCDSGSLAPPSASVVLRLVE